MNIPSPFEFKQTLRVIPPIYWIVSYPRSGNTFVRTLLANYASDLDRPLGLQEIEHSSCGEHIETFWLEATGKYPKDRQFIDELRARPAYFEQVRSVANAGMPLVKSHTMCCSIDGFPTFKFEPSDRIIHIIRHPCDVAVSFADYYDFDLETTIEILGTEGKYFVDKSGAGYEVIGSWAQHARGWMTDLGAPVMHVKYCDLVAKPVETTLEMAAFLGMSPDRRRAEQVVAFSRFDRLKAQEAENGFAETAKTAGQGYFREGRPGQWLESLTIRQAQAILDRDPDLIALFNYPKVSIV